ncbi:MAG: isoleucine--tRNA ligase [Mycoplasmoidaceae bacterium]
MADLKEQIKNSLNMGKTGLEMKANLNVKEPKIQQSWIDGHVYEQVLEHNHKENKQWILHDGPPYANGDLHVGHALNKILKDIIVRYKNSKGFYAPFVIGWDTHGLPIEHALSKKLGKDYNQLLISEKRQKCYDFALANIAKQKEQFSKFGLFTDYDKIYMTMTKDYETRQLNLFLSMIEQKLIFQALKPVYWSWSSQTALAEAEIEYKDLEADSIYVGFNVVDGKQLLEKDDQIVIWTTTPWTIPSNLAVAVNPEFEYVRVAVGSKHYVVAKQLLTTVAKAIGWNQHKIVKTFKGQDLEKVMYAHPLYNKPCPIILADYVSMDDGTGCVHNAPGFGDDDYLACKAYKIEPFCPIDKMGRFTAEVNDKELEGIFYEDANASIIERLKANGNLLKASKIVHSAAIDWRTKKPVLYRATKQWFVNINNIKKDIIKNLNAVKFNSESNKNHMKEMIQNRSEWCISRQRVWGVPICIIYDDKEQPLLDLDLCKHIVDILSKEGTNVWFEKPVEYFLTDKYHGKHYTKCMDTMDVWFDSGSSHMMFETLGWNKQCDLYLEGNDQYRGWFNSSIITSTIVKKCSPYKQLISHGMTVDEQGRKMSKSLGNGVDPLKVCAKYGADILRMWVANSNYVADVAISENILKQISEIYRRIRNSLFRFCLSNLADYDFAKDAKYFFGPEDLYVLNQLKTNIKKINQAYETFDFSVIVKTINAHVIELSSWYFDLIKDTLYCDEANNEKRRTIQTVLYFLLNSYLCFLAPIIPHTAFEVHGFVNKPNKAANIMLEPWVDKLPFEVEPINQEMWNMIFKLKDLVFTKIEKTRNDKVIAKNNEADITLSFNNNLKIDPALLKKIFNVAKVTINSTNDDKITVEATKTNYVKCIRCWNYYPADEVQDELCPRCAKLLKK